MSFQINSTIDTKLNVKPVKVSLYHNYVYEGPCRFEAGENLKKEYDMKVNAERYRTFIEPVKAALPTEDVNLLEPVHIHVDEGFQPSNEQFAEITKDISSTDLYILDAGLSGDPFLEFVRRHKKPVICFNTMMTSAMLARGLEVYPCGTMADLTEIIKVLRVRKALAETKVLLLNRLNSNNAPAMIDSFVSLDEVTAKLGTRFRYFNIHEFMDQLHNVPDDTNPTTPGRHESNINDADEAEIGKMTDEFIADAVECDMRREDILPSMRAHYLIKKLLFRFDCNAFAAPCFDVCATRRFNEERFTFCLNHSLNNESCISSACEYDLCALLSMVVLSNFAKASAYMGNTSPNPAQKGAMAILEDVPEELAKLENLVLTLHSVPNRKLQGYNTKNAPYAIRSFTHSGWGATVRYDFAKDKGQKLTMCRFDPSCTKLFVARGTVVGGTGYKDVNCTEGVFFQVEGSGDLFEKLSMVGHHVPLVYGDYFDQVVKLGKILGLEVLTV